jgi:hypothetical protein
MAQLEAQQRAAQPLGDNVRIAAGPAVQILAPPPCVSGSARWWRAPSSKGTRRSLALVDREVAVAAGAPPGSIQELYLARGRETRAPSPSAMNLRPALPCRPGGVPCCRQD